VDEKVSEDSEIDIKITEDCELFIILMH